MEVTSFTLLKQGMNRFGKMNNDDMMEQHECDACLHADSVMATNQELLAGVLIALLYVHRLDLSVGDAGTVLVKGGRSTGETCPTGQGVERDLCSGG